MRRILSTFIAAATLTVSIAPAMAQSQYDYQQQINRNNLEIQRENSIRSTEQNCAFAWDALSKAENEYNYYPSPENDNKRLRAQMQLDYANQKMAGLTGGDCSSSGGGQYAGNGYGWNPYNGGNYGWDKYQGGRRHHRDNAGKDIALGVVAGLAGAVIAGAVNNNGGLNGVIDKTFGGGRDERRYIDAPQMPPVNEMTFNKHLNCYMSNRETGVNHFGTTRYGKVCWRNNQMILLMNKYGELMELGQAPTTR
ncbi:MAG: hypothetical protein DI585_06925 [Pseudomonas fluorescens]|nr:MAG: hypothetical protein DI585_06925 [Pseudomonas fluorescens]